MELQQVVSGRNQAPFRACGRPASSFEAPDPSVRLDLAKDRLDPAGEEGIGVFGYIDAHHRQGYRLRLKDPGVLEAAMPDSSPAFRELDAAILESLLLRDALGMTAEEIEAKRGIAYTASIECSP